MRLLMSQLLAFVILPLQCLAEECTLLAGEDDGAMRDYAMEYATYIEADVVNDILFWSESIFSNSQPFDVEYPPSRRCISTASVEGMKVEMPPIFLEHLMLKAEDYAITQLMMDAALPKLPQLKNEELVEFTECTVGVANYNHVAKKVSIADVCGSSWEAFLSAWRSLRSEQGNWELVEDAFYYLYYFALAHEYGHILSGHSPESLTKENEIEADMIAYQLLSEGRADWMDAFVMKQFVSVNAAFMDVEGLADLTGEEAPTELTGTPLQESHKYLSSECRTYEVLSRLGLLAEIEVQLSRVAGLSDLEIGGTTPIDFEQRFGFGLRGILINC